MSGKRDEFTAEAKKKISYCAGFKCCFPECGQVLVGRANNKNGYVFNGEYAHITAAAPGGPRYDASLSEEERKSYENGILLCRNHASLIDKDEGSYPVELIKKWKEIAENDNLDKLQNNKYDEKSEEEIEASFSTLFDDGDFIELEKRINEYKPSFDDNKNEVVLRYKILIDLLNDYDAKKDIEKYVVNKNKNLPLILNELIIFDRKEYADTIYISTDDVEIKDVISIVRTNSAAALLSIKNFIDYFKKYEKAIEHLQLQILFKDKYACYFKSKEGSIVRFEDESFLYELIINAITLKRKVKLLDDVTSEELNNAFIFFVKHLDKINKLPDYYRLEPLILLLNYLATYKIDSYLNIYNELFDSDKNNIETQKSYYRYKLNSNTATIDEIEVFCKNTSNYEFLCFIVYNMKNEDAKKYLDEHLFLLNESSLFLLRYLMIIDELERKGFFAAYKGTYPQDDFVSSCLSWLYYDELDKRDVCFNLETSPDKGINMFNAMIYLHTLVCKKECDHYFELVYTLRGVDIDILLSAFELQNLTSENDEYNQKLIDLYEIKIKEGVKLKNLKYYLAILYCKKEETKRADELLSEEFDEYKSINSIHSLLAMRIERREFIKDDKFESAKRFLDYGCQLYVAETLEQERDYEKALIYYERAIICNEEDKAARIQIFEITNFLKIKQKKEINQSVVVTLKSETEEIIVFFHSEEVIGDFKDTCENHYSVEDAVFNDFYLNQVGDEVTYKSSLCKIINIDDIYAYYAKQGFQILINDPHTIKFEGGCVEESISEITKILMSRNKEIEKGINDYLSFAKACPISISSKRIFGSNLFANLSFIYSDKNRTNIDLCLDNVKEKNYSKIYFYYDSLFILFCMYSEKIFKIGSNWCIPNRIYLDLKNECNERIKDVENNIERINVINGRPTRILQNKKGRTNDRKWYKEFISFLNKFSIEKGSLLKLGDYIGVIKDWDKDIKSERELFNLLNSNNDSCVVSDSTFIHYICGLLKKDRLATFNLLEFYFDSEFILILNNLLNQKD